MAACINSMLNFTENMGDAETPSKAGCPSKPSWPGSYKQALNKPCVIFKVQHSFLSVLTLKREMLEQCQCFFPCFRLCNLFLLTDILIILLIVIVIVNRVPDLQNFSLFLIIIVAVWCTVSDSLHRTSQVKRIVHLVNQAQSCLLFETNHQ